MARAGFRGCSQLMASALVFAITVGACGKGNKTEMRAALAPGECIDPVIEGIDSTDATMGSATEAFTGPTTCSDCYGLPGHRATRWNPGITTDPLGTGNLGTDRLPVRDQTCATLSASDYGNGTIDATQAINDAIDACGQGQVVRLSEGEFLINGNLQDSAIDYVAIDKSDVVLRGAGAGKTILKRTNGVVFGGDGSAETQTPVIIVGAVRWPHPDESSAQALTSDGVKGTYSVKVANAAKFQKGQIVVLDEMSKGHWQHLPNQAAKPLSACIWAGDRVIWNFDTTQGDSQFGPIVDGDLTGPGTTWYSRQDRPVNEIKEVESISGDSIHFSDPLHIGYRVNHEAQVTGFEGSPAIQDSGVEMLTVQGGSNGNIRFENAARCWAKNIENKWWGGVGFEMTNSYRIVIRDSYVHDGVWPEPGGGGYAIGFSNGTSESLVENTISLRANKVMVVRSAGAGSVVGYNYMDNGLVMSNPAWVEVGINGSHMLGPHHMLFEGNYSYNADSDSTWGSSIYHTFFRNHLSGRRLGGTALTGTQREVTLEDSETWGFMRCAGLGYGSRWMSFVGNVLGLPGQMDAWRYERLLTLPEEKYIGTPSVWILGHGSGPGGDWNMTNDPQVLTTVIRDGNYDYLTNTVQWHTHPDQAGKKLPASLYLSGRPAFFGENTWPWVDPLDTTQQFYTLPAKYRFDQGTPNDVP